MNNDFEIRGRETAIFIKTTKGETLETLISTNDLEKVRDFIGYWYPIWSEGTKSYYVSGYGGLVNEPKRMWSLHRWLMDDPEDFVVDHINHNTLDNSYPNLRVVSQSVNMLNRENTGVVKYIDRWKAQFVFQGKHHNLGYFDSEEEARQVVAKEKGSFIEREVSDDAYEYDLQKAREGLDNDEDFHIVHCENCGSQNTLELSGTFDTRGNKIHSFFECNNCGAEDADEII